MKINHRVTAIISWGLLAAALIHLCFKWSSMPETTGVHFDGDGNFDVFASKKFIAYPFIVGIFFLLLLQLAAHSVRKLRIGLKVNAEGEAAFRERIMLLIDANRLFISLYAVYWAELVIYQHKLMQQPVAAGMMILFVLLIDVFRMIPVLKRKYPLSDE